MGYCLPHNAPQTVIENIQKKTWLGRFVVGTRSLDLSLEEIREILTMQDRKEAPWRTLLNLIEQKADQIEERIRLLRQMEVDLRRLHQVGLTFTTDDIDGKNCICHLVSEHSNVNATS